MKKNGGNMLAVFLGILMLVAIILPLVIQLLQTESKQSVNHQKSTVAFQLAEAAVAKGVAKLSENRKNWTDAIAAIPVAGYNDDVQYTDMGGGGYKVKFSPGSAAGTVRIIGKGMDSSSREVRSIEAEYSQIDPDQSAVILNKGSVADMPLPVHWGSVKGYSDFGCTPTFPILHSAGKARPRDANPAPPNSNGVDYWAYRSDMGSAPMPDLAYYKLKAQNSIVPSSSTTGEIRNGLGAPVTRNPPNSGYFQSTLNATGITMDKLTALPEGMGNRYEFRSSTSVIYYDFGGAGGGMSIRRAFLDVEAVISPNAPVSFLNSTTPFNVFMATIPASAPFQYQGTTIWDAGNPVSAQTVWASTFSAVYAQPNHCCYGIPSLQIHGYYYEGVSPMMPNIGKIAGVFHTNGSSPGWSNGSVIYFDANVFANVVWAQSPLHRLSWKESSQAW